MRVFRNKISKEVFRVKDSESKILKALEHNDGFEELYEAQVEDLKTSQD